MVTVTINIRKLSILWAKTRADNSKYWKLICYETYSFGRLLCSITSETYIFDISAFEQFSTSNVRISEGTFCRVWVHILFNFLKRYLVVLTWPGGYKKNFHPQGLK